jgi:hypothetical protein
MMKKLFFLFLFLFFLVPTVLSDVLVVDDFVL